MAQVVGSTTEPNVTTFTTSDKPMHLLFQVLEDAISILSWS